MSHEPTLSACFLHSRPEGVPEPGETELQSYVASARARWPTLTELTDAELIRHVAERCDERGLPPPEHAGDLLLALGCVRRLSGALAAFEQTYSEVIARVLSHRRADGLADDVAQTVRERLLFGSDDTPAQIVGYRGIGPLRSWVATATSTQLAMARRSQGRRREDPAQSSLAQDVVARDPELLYLQQRYRHEVEQALVHALRTLADRERTLLRLQLGERLTLPQLAKMYAVDRATVARWLAKARATLLEALRVELRTRTGAEAGTCEDLLRLVHSQLDVSVLRHLR